MNENINSTLTQLDQNYKANTFFPANYELYIDKSIEEIFDVFNYNIDSFFIDSDENSSSIRISFTDIYVDIPKDVVSEYPYIYIYDISEKEFNLKQFYRLVIYDTLYKFYRSHSNSDYNIISRLRHYISRINELQYKADIWTRNNAAKINNRVFVINPFVSEKDNIYYEYIGDALLYGNVIRAKKKLRSIIDKFSNLISVTSAAEGIFCKEHDEYKAPGFYRDSEKIITIFPKKSNIPERLRQHITSEYKRPVMPEKDPLMPEDYPAEKIGALCIFLNIGDKEDSPFGKYSLIGGEIPISKELSERQVYSSRVLLCKKDVYVMPVGTILKPGDPIAINYNGENELIYNFKYPGAVIQSVELQDDLYKITLQIKTGIGVSRIINEIGLKGVTIPYRNLGYVELPEDILEEGEDNRFPVSMVLGPVSMKSLNNGLKLSWIALKNVLKETHTYIDPSSLSEDDIEALCSDLRMVKWHYNGKVYDVYCGYVTFGVTELSADYKTDFIRIMPETLKIMLTSNNADLEEITYKLLDKYSDAYSQQFLREIISYFVVSQEDIDNAVSIESSEIRAMLLEMNIMIAKNPSEFLNNKIIKLFPNGLTLKVGSRYIKLPSLRMISNVAISFGINSIYVINDFAVQIGMIYRNLRDYVKRSIDENTLYDRITIINEILKKRIIFKLFEKHGYLASAVAVNGYGGYFKQMLCAFIPQGISVVIDKELEKKIVAFRAENEDMPIYEIGVRNPVIWRHQFQVKQVWTRRQFEKHIKAQGISLSKYIDIYSIEGCVLRSPYDILLDQSDCDGDLYPVCIIFDKEIQQRLDRYYKENNYKLKNYEQEWTDSYLNDELAKAFDHNAKFKFHIIEKSWFVNTFTNAVIAKADVGKATSSLWKFNAASEFAYLNGELTYDEMLYVQFLYSKIVQDYVIRGIKHNDSGSSAFSKYYLPYFNYKEVAQDLYANHSISADMIKKFLKVAKLAQKNRMFSIISTLPNGKDMSILSKNDDIWESSMQNLANLYLNRDVYKDISYYRLSSEFIDNVLCLLSMQQTL